MMRVDVLRSSLGEPWNWTPWSTTAGVLALTKLDPSCYVIGMGRRSFGVEGWNCPLSLSPMERNNQG
jgi:hypothetical protein